jgi:uncharacterized membrane protein YeaQ/YmgE (transglycosylase-associated protein family)
MTHIIGQIFSGLVIGLIAQLLIPGDDVGGWTLKGIAITALIGIGGSFIGSMAGKALFKENYAAGWGMSIAGAILLLIVSRIIF